LLQCDLPPPHLFPSTPPPASQISTLSLHDALPISEGWRGRRRVDQQPGKQQHRADQCDSGRKPRSAARCPRHLADIGQQSAACRSEEHTSELQSRGHLVCRLLLEKKKKDNNMQTIL